MTKLIKVGVFPLKEIVLYPNTILPLVIQDPNYQKMINDSIQFNFPIAIGLGDPVFTREGGVSQTLLRPKEILGLGLATISEDYDDGSQYVVFQGIGKVKLLKVIHQVPYLLCEAEILYDQESSPTTLPHNPISRLESVLTKWLRYNIADPVHLNSLLASMTTVNHIVDYLAAFLIQDRDIKQILLETSNLTERIHMLDILLKGQKPQHEDHIVANIIKRFEYDDRPFAANQ